ncbi:MAG TPA: YkgJ family cysteine cluster protein [Verrucomicrobiaceae bacterium]|jgi:Fe-S-cluster containining protein
MSLDCATEINSIYAELATRALPRECVSRTECCQFRLTGKTPMLTKGEAAFAAIGVRAGGRKKISPTVDGSCPMLGRNGRCTIYAHRPFGCRTHFCAAAGGPYPRQHVSDLIQRLDALDEKLGGDGPRPIEGAVADALKAID